MKSTKDSNPTHFCICFSVMFSQFQFLICFVLLWIQSATSSLVNRHSYFMDSNPEHVVADMIYSKNHHANKVLSKTSLVQDVDIDFTYLLSKLSDDELIKLLNNQPKKAEYDLNDIVRIVFAPKAIAVSKQTPNEYPKKQRELVGDALNENLGERANNNNMAYFRLADERTDPSITKPNSESNYNAIQKLNNLLQSYPQNQDAETESGEDIDQKELLFDVLVSQLKSLCCKKRKPFRSRSLKHNPISKLDNQYIFLIVNEEIQGNGTDDLITVDPDSLQSNSSVLILGSLSTPLSEDQLKLIVNRISRELSSPQYLPLLQQLADGTLSDKNNILMKNIITGPQTRRHVKAHRCNHQSKLAQIYDGPKWLICTGYLNLNVPSIYD